MSDPTTNGVALMASLQDKVRERIQSTFMELLPDAMFQDLVKRELDRLMKVDLPSLVRDAASTRVKQLLEEEFKKPEWSERFGVTGPRASEMVTQIVRETAPNLVEAMFSMFAQTMVQDMRNGRLRAY